jgi:PAS domain S-box-containing protein
METVEAIGDGFIPGAGCSQGASAGDGALEVRVARPTSSSTWIPKIVAPTVLIFGMGFSVAIAWMDYDRIAYEQRIAFQHATEQIQHQVLERMRRYEVGLRGCRALFIASESVTRDEFRVYSRSRRHASEYPGSLGIGFIQRVRQADVDAFESTFSADGLPEFTVHPRTEASEQYVIKYIEPVDDNRQALGYNVGSDPAQREAADLARDTGECTTTRMIRLVQDTEQRPSVLMMLPYYQGEPNPPTLAARRENLVGWICMPLILDDVMRPICQGIDRAMDFEIFDGDVVSEASQFFGRYPAKTVPIVDRAFTATIPMTIAGRTWTLRVQPRTSFFERWDAWQPWAIGSVGCLVSLIVTAMVWVLGRRRQVAEAMAKRMTRSLRESESRFRAAAEGGLSSFYLLKSVRDLDDQIVDFEFVDANGRGLEMLNSDREQVIGRRLCELLLINRTAGFFQRCKRVVETGSPFEDSFELPVPDCRSRWLHHEVVKVGDGIAITSDDITDRKLAEEQLRQERTRLANVIEGTRIGTWEWNVQTGDTVFNDHWAWMLGYDVDELDSTTIQTWQQLCHPDDLAVCKIALAAHFKGRSEEFDREFRVKHKDGHWVWIHNRGRVLSRDDRGRPLLMFGTYSDITKRKRIEQELRTLSHAVEQDRRLGRHHRHARGD